jgi:hypothetical protein
MEAALIDIQSHWDSFQNVDENFQRFFENGRKRAREHHVRVNFETELQVL